MEPGEREMVGVTCCAGWIWCCRGDESGDPLDRDDRSEAEEWIESSCTKKKKTTVSIAVHNRGLRGENGESGAGFTNIILRQQVGTELQVVVQIK